MNSNAMILSARSQRLLFVVGLGVLLSLVLVTLRLNDLGKRSQDNGTTLSRIEHSLTTASATQSTLILECFLQSGQVLSNQSLGSVEFSPDMAVRGLCHLAEREVTTGEPTPAPKSYSDPDSSVILPKSLPDLRTHTKP